jgi:hypothetical protein
MSLRSFGLKLDSFVNTVKEAHAETVRSVAQVAITEVVRLTPIDTSRAQTNWVPTLNAPFLGEVPFSEGHRGSTAGSAFTATQRAMALVRNQYRFGDSIYIRNNVPYIEELESGTRSAQAPSGMLKLTVQAINMDLKKE